VKLHLTRKSASFFAVALLAVATAGPALAQPSDDDSPALVKTIVALTIANTQSLNFGTLVVNGTLTADANVTVGANLDSAGTISSDSGEVVPLSGHTESVFSVSGDAGEVVQVNFPASTTLHKGAGGTAATDMTVAFTSADISVYDDTTPTELFGTPAANQFIMPADGDATLEVGGVLTVKDEDDFGDFAGTFNIEVVYV
jgi:hypothetical protein